MDHFTYRDGRLYVEDVPLSHVAEQVGTPCYVYSRATLERHWHAFDRAFLGLDHLVCYAAKANSNLAVLNLFARLGSGFDIVSLGELERVRRAGGDMAKVVFSGVGKSEADILGALAAGVMCFNVESEAELERLNRLAAAQGVSAPMSLRVNPDVDAKTHPYIATGLRENKFGIPINRAREVYGRAAAMSNIKVIGVDCHIGSQLTEIAPFLDALERVLQLVDELSSGGIELDHLDLGGGLGIRYRDEAPPEPADYADAIVACVKERGVAQRILIEPGRAIAGNAGVMLTRVEYIKQAPEKNFAVVDGAMNDLMRPALYQAWQDIVAVCPRVEGETRPYDVVGPVCETGDFLGKDRQLNIQAGDLLAVRSAGAYGASMSSNYNSRPRAPEVLVDGDEYHVVRRRETLDDLFRTESLLPNSY
ncbi:MAG TPA: diaminopimelate decarboxylase [Acidiferrobacteraceae bacterium]|nr:diaminopimelate decarboxylase [Acidiferrobacteraceae bacterium]